MIKKSFTVKSPDGKFTHSFDSDWYDMTFKGGVIDLENIIVPYKKLEIYTRNDIYNYYIKVINGKNIVNTSRYGYVIKHKNSNKIYHTSFLDEKLVNYLEIYINKNDSVNVHQPLKFYVFQSGHYGPVTIINDYYLKYNNTRFFICYRKDQT